MKKRILVTLLCAMLGITGMAGCGEKDPKTQLSEVFEKASSIENVDMSTSTNITMEAQGETLEMPMNMDIKMKDAKKDTLSMEMVMNMSVMGQEVETTTYYTDGYYYMDTSGSKGKYAMDVEELREQMKSGVVYQDLTQDMFQEVTMEKDGDRKIFSFTGNLEQMEDYLKDAMGSLDELFGDGIEYGFSDVEGSITVVDNEMKDIEMNYSMEVSMQGETINATVESTSTINATGDEVEFELPDLTDYEELDAPIPAE